MNAHIRLALAKAVGGKGVEIGCNRDFRPDALEYQTNERPLCAKSGRSVSGAFDHSRLSTIEVPVHLRSPGVMVPVQASARPQPVPRRPCRAAPSRRSRTQGQEAAAV